MCGTRWKDGKDRLCLRVFDARDDIVGRQKLSEANEELELLILTEIWVFQRPESLSFADAASLGIEYAAYEMIFP